MAPIPEKLRQRLLDQGFSNIEIGNLQLNLATGAFTRSIALDGVELGRFIFPSKEIDWDIISEVIS